MTERTRNLVAAAVLAISIGTVVVLLASSPPADADRVHALASRLRCPVCDSESIADSPSTIARDLYTLIEEQVAGGATNDEIVDFFVATYGEQVLLDPRFDGRTLALWVVPALAVITGAIVIISRKRAAAPRSLTGDERRRLAAMQAQDSDDA